MKDCIMHNLSFGSHSCSESFMVCTEETLRSRELACHWQSEVLLSSPAIWPTLRACRTCSPSGHLRVEGGKKAWL